jgi:hypothetical protein
MRTLKAVYDPKILTSLKGYFVVCDLSSKDQHLISLDNVKIKAVRDDSGKDILLVFCEKHRCYLPIPTVSSSALKSEAQK